MVFFLIFIVIIIKFVCEVLFFILVFDFEFSLLVIFNEVFNFY